MIELTRLNGALFFLNIAHIETIEALPDTTITLTSGKKIIVLDNISEVRDRINSRYRSFGLLASRLDRGGERK